MIWKALALAGVALGAIAVWLGAANGFAIGDLWDRVWEIEDDRG